MLIHSDSKRGFANPERLRRLAVRIPEGAQCVIATCILAATLAATTLNGQPHPAIGLAGKIAHLSSIVLISFFLVTTTRHWLIPGTLIAVCAVLKLFDGIEFVRTIYLAGLFALFFFAGAVLSLRFWREIERVFLVVVLLSICVALSQLLGVHDWLFSLSTVHAYLGEVGFDLALHNPIFQPAAEVSASITQMRPSALFSSNTVLAFFVLMAFAVFLSSTNRRWLPLVVAAALAVLSMAKGAVLGVIILTLTLTIFFSGCRWALWPATASIAGAIAFYATLFPGVTAISMSPPVIMASLLVRAADLMEALGLADEVDRAVNYIFARRDSEGELVFNSEGSLAFTIERWKNSAAQPESDLEDRAQVRALAQEVAADQAAFGKFGSLSLYSALARHPFYASITLLMLLTVSVLFSSLRMVLENPQNLAKFAAITLALLLSGVFQNFAEMPIFWMFLGMGCAWCLSGLVTSADRPHADPS